MRVVLRPSTPADFEELIGRSNLEHRVKAITAVADGKVVAIGGLAFTDELVWMFLEQSPDFAKYPVAIHRAGLAGIEMAKELGLSQVVATTSKDNPKAQRWLRRLGYVDAPEQRVPGRIVFLWNRRDA